ncbi:serine-rich adhesin for platelets, partial [Aplysia californica]|uniref:Serine-rich adhesin for platelets n=1 Tax=Aplysia californica TaxID=6500 RepID=A0ABM0ZXB5_APLCA
WTKQSIHEVIPASDQAVTSLERTNPDTDELKPASDRAVTSSVWTKQSIHEVIPASDQAVTSLERTNPDTDELIPASDRAVTSSVLTEQDAHGVKPASDRALTSSEASISGVDASESNTRETQNPPSGGGGDGTVSSSTTSATLATVNSSTTSATLASVSSSATLATSASVSSSATLATVSSSSTLATVSSSSTLATVSSSATLATVSSSATLATVSSSATLATVSSSATLATVSSSATLATVSSSSTLATVSSESLPRDDHPAPPTHQNTTTVSPTIAQRLHLLSSHVSRGKSTVMSSDQTTTTATSAQEPSHEKVVPATQTDRPEAPAVEAYQNGGHTSVDRLPEEKFTRGDQNKTLPTPSRGVTDPPSTLAGRDYVTKSRDDQTRLKPTPSPRVTERGRRQKPETYHVIVPEVVDPDTGQGHSTSRTFPQTSGGAATPAVTSSAWTKQDAHEGKQASDQAVTSSVWTKQSIHEVIPASDQAVTSSVWTKQDAHELKPASDRAVTSSVWTKQSIHEVIPASDQAVTSLERTNPDTDELIPASDRALTSSEASISGVDASESNTRETQNPPSGGGGDGTVSSSTTSATLATVNSSTTSATLATSASVSSSATLATVSSSSTLATVSSSSTLATVSSSSTLATVSSSATLATVSSSATLATVSSSATLATVSSSSTLATVSSESLPRDDHPAPPTHQNTTTVSPTIAQRPHLLSSHVSRGKSTVMSSDQTTTTATSAQEPSHEKVVPATQTDRPEAPAVEAYQNGGHTSVDRLPEEKFTRGDQNKTLPTPSRGVTDPPSTLAGRDYVTKSRDDQTRLKPTPSPRVTERVTTQSKHQKTETTLSQTKRKTFGHLDFSEFSEDKKDVTSKGHNEDVRFTKTTNRMSSDSSRSSLFRTTPTLSDRKPFSFATPKQFPSAPPRGSTTSSSLSDHHDVEVSGRYYEGSTAAPNTNSDYFEQKTTAPNTSSDYFKEKANTLSQTKGKTVDHSEFSEGKNDVTLMGQDETAKLTTTNRMSTLSSQEEIPLDESTLSSQKEIPLDESTLSSQKEIPLGESTLSSQKEIPLDESTLSSQKEIPLGESTLSSQKEIPLDESTLSSQKEIPLDESTLSSQKEIPLDESTLYSQKEIPLDESTLSSHKEIPLDESTLSSQKEIPLDESTLSSQKEIPLDESTLSSQLEIPLDESTLSSQKEIPLDESTLSSQEKIPLGESTQSSETDGKDMHLDKSTQSFEPFQKNTPLEDSTSRKYEKDIPLNESFQSVETYQKDTALKVSTPKEQKDIPLEASTGSSGTHQKHIPLEASTGSSGTHQKHIPLEASTGSSGTHQKHIPLEASTGSSGTHQKHIPLDESTLSLETYHNDISMGKSTSETYHSDIPLVESAYSSQKDLPLDESTLSIEAYHKNIPLEESTSETNQKSIPFDESTYSSQKDIPMDESIQTAQKDIPLEQSTLAFETYQKNILKDESTSKTYQKEISTKESISETSQKEISLDLSTQSSQNNILLEKSSLSLGTYQKNIPLDESTSKTYQKNIPSDESTSETYQKNIPLDESTSETYQKNIPLDESTSETYQKNKPWDESTSETYQKNIPLEESTLSSQKDIPMGESISKTHQKDKTVEESTSGTHQKDKSLEESTSETHQKVNTLEESTAETHQKDRHLEESSSESHQKNIPLEEATLSSQNDIPMGESISETHQKVNTLEESTAETHQKVNTLKESTAETHQKVNTLEESTAETHQKVNTLEESTAETHQKVNTLEESTADTHQKDNTSEEPTQSPQTSTPTWRTPHDVHKSLSSPAVSVHESVLSSGVRPYARDDGTNHVTSEETSQRLETKPTSLTTALMPDGGETQRSPQSLGVRRTTQRAQGESIHWRGTDVNTQATRTSEFLEESIHSRGANIRTQTPKTSEFLEESIHSTGETTQATRTSKFLEESIHARGIDTTTKVTKLETSSESPEIKTTAAAKQNHTVVESYRLSSERETPRKISEKEDTPKETSTLSVKSTTMTHEKGRLKEVLARVLGTGTSTRDTQDKDDVRDTTATSRPTVTLTSSEEDKSVISTKQTESIPQTEVTRLPSSSSNVLRHSEVIEPYLNKRNKTTEDLSEILTSSEEDSPASFTKQTESIPQTEVTGPPSSKNTQRHSEVIEPYLNKRNKTTKDISDRRTTPKPSSRADILEDESTTTSVTEVSTKSSLVALLLGRHKEHQQNPTHSSNTTTMPPSSPQPKRFHEPNTISVPTSSTQSRDITQTLLLNKSSQTTQLGTISSSPLMTQPSQTSRLTRGQDRNDFTAISSSDRTHSQSTDPIRLHLTTERSRMSEPRKPHKSFLVQRFDQIWETPESYVPSQTDQVVGSSSESARTETMPMSTQTTDPNRSTQTTHTDASIQTTIPGTSIQTTNPSTSIQTTNPSTSIQTTNTDTSIYTHFTTTIKTPKTIRSENAPTTYPDHLIDDTEKPMLTKGLDGILSTSGDGEFTPFSIQKVSVSSGELRKPITSTKTNKHAHLIDTYMDVQTVEGSESNLISETDTSGPSSAPHASSLPGEPDMSSIDAKLDTLSPTTQLYTLSQTTQKDTLSQTTQKDTLSQTTQKDTPSQSTQQDTLSQTTQPDTPSQTTQPDKLKTPSEFAKSSPTPHPASFTQTRGSDNRPLTAEKDKSVTSSNLQESSNPHTERTKSSSSTNLQESTIPQTEVTRSPSSNVQEPTIPLTNETKSSSSNLQEPSNPRTERTRSPSSISNQIKPTIPQTKRTKSLSSNQQEPSIPPTEETTSSSSNQKKSTISQTEETKSLSSSNLQEPKIPQTERTRSLSSNLQKSTIPQKKRTGSLSSSNLQEPTIPLTERTKYPSSNQQEPTIPQAERTSSPSSTNVQGRSDIIQPFLDNSAPEDVPSSHTRKTNTFTTDTNSQPAMVATRKKSMNEATVSNTKETAQVLEKVRHSNNIAALSTPHSLVTFSALSDTLTGSQQSVGTHSRRSELGVENNTVKLDTPAPQSTSTSKHFAVSEGTARSALTKPTQIRPKSRLEGRQSQTGNPPPSVYYSGQEDVTYETPPPAQTTRTREVLEESIHSKGTYTPIQMTKLGKSSESPETKTTAAAKQNHTVVESYRLSSERETPRKIFEKEDTPKETSTLSVKSTTMTHEKGRLKEVLARVLGTGTSTRDTQDKDDVRDTTATSRPTVTLTSSEEDKSVISTKQTESIPQTEVTRLPSSSSNVLRHSEVIEPYLNKRNKTTEDLSEILTSSEEDSPASFTKQTESIPQTEVTGPPSSKNTQRHSEVIEPYLNKRYKTTKDISERRTTPKPSSRADILEDESTTTSVTEVSTKSSLVALLLGRHKEHQQNPTHSSNTTTMPPSSPQPKRFHEPNTISVPTSSTQSRDITQTLLLNKSSQTTQLGTISSSPLMTQPSQTSRLTRGQDRNDFTAISSSDRTHSQSTDPIRLHLTTERSRMSEPRKPHKSFLVQRFDQIWETPESYVPSQTDQVVGSSSESARTETMPMSTQTTDPNRSTQTTHTDASIQTTIPGTSIQTTNPSTSIQTTNPSTSIQTTNTDTSIYTHFTTTIKTPKTIRSENAPTTYPDHLIDDTEKPMLTKGLDGILSTSGDGEFTPFSIQKVSVSSGELRKPITSTKTNKHAHLIDTYMDVQTVEGSESNLISETDTSGPSSAPHASSLPGEPDMSSIDAKLDTLSPTTQLYTLSQTTQKDTLSQTTQKDTLSQTTQKDTLSQTTQKDTPSQTTQPDTPSQTTQPDKLKTPSEFAKSSPTPHPASFTQTRGSDNRPLTAEKDKSVTSSNLQESSNPHTERTKSSSSTNLQESTIPQTEVTRSPSSNVQEPTIPLTNETKSSSSNLQEPSNPRTERTRSPSSISNQIKPTIPQTKRTKSLSSNLQEPKIPQTERTRFLSSNLLKSTIPQKKRTGSLSSSNLQEPTIPLTERTKYPSSNQQEPTIPQAERTSSPSSTNVQGRSDIIQPFLDNSAPEDVPSSHTRKTNTFTTDTNSQPAMVATRKKSMNEATVSNTKETAQVLEKVRHSNNIAALSTPHSLVTFSALSDTLTGSQQSVGTHSRRSELGVENNTVKLDTPAPQSTSTSKHFAVSEGTARSALTKPTQIRPKSRLEGRQSQTGNPPPSVYYSGQEDVTYETPPPAQTTRTREVLEESIHSKGTYTPIQMTKLGKSSESEETKTTAAAKQNHTVVESYRLSSERETPRKISTQDKELDTGCVTSPPETPAQPSTEDKRHLKGREDTPVVMATPSSNPTITRTTITKNDVDESFTSSNSRTTTPTTTTLMMKVLSTGDPTSDPGRRVALCPGCLQPVIDRITHQLWVLTKTAYKHHLSFLEVVAELTRLRRELERYVMTSLRETIRREVEREVRRVMSLQLEQTGRKFRKRRSVVDMAQKVMKNNVELLYGNKEPTLTTKLQSVSAVIDSKRRLKREGTREEIVPRSTSPTQSEDFYDADFGNIFGESFPDTIDPTSPTMKKFVSELGAKSEIMTNKIDPSSTCVLCRPKIDKILAKLLLLAEVAHKHNLSFREVVAELTALRRDLRSNVERSMVEVVRQEVIQQVREAVRRRMSV